MTIREIFLRKLEAAGYANKGAFTYYDETLDFSGFVNMLEEDNIAIFRAMYGDVSILNRGTRNIKEADYRLAEAINDVKKGFIGSTMHYILTQIKIGGIKL